MNFNVSRADIGDYIRKYAIEKNLLSNLNESWFRASSWKMGQSLLLYSTSISVLAWNARKFLDLYNKHPKIDSTILFNQW